MSKDEGQTAYYAGTNSIPRAEGRVTHLGLADGELANRIVSVGSISRAKTLKACLDDPASAFELTSDRGFTTYTGTFEGVRVSIVATGMGAPMMDFLVREGRAVVDGPMIMVRYGSCGGLRDDALPGTVALNTPGAVYVQRNYDHFAAGGGTNGSSSPYVVTKPVEPDAAVAAAARDALKAALGERLIEGLNASSDSFYGSQGRLDDAFVDENGTLVDTVLADHPSAASMEMESFQLLHLAACSRGTVRAATAAIVCANRASADVITKELLHECEAVGGRAMLQAIAKCKLDDEGGPASKRAKTA